MSKDILVFTNQQNVHKVFDPISYVQEDVLNQIELEEGEEAIYTLRTADYAGYVITIFENGKAAKVPLTSFQTKTKRKKLKNAFSGISPLVYITSISEDIDLIAVSSINKVLLFNTSEISVQKTPSSSGINMMTSKDGSSLAKILKPSAVQFSDLEFYRKKIPAIGYYLKEADELPLEE